MYRVHMLKTGLYPAKLAAMPVSGVNMPVTIGGSSVIVAAEFLREWTGIQVSPSIGEWTSACQTGMFAALEKAYVAMVVAAFTGFHPEIGLGHLRDHM